MQRIAVHILVQPPVVQPPNHHPHRIAHQRVIETRQLPRAQVPRHDQYALTARLAPPGSSPAPRSGSSSPCSPACSAACGKTPPVAAPGSDTPRAESSAALSAESSGNASSRFRSPTRRSRPSAMVNNESKQAGQQRATPRGTTPGCAPRPRPANIQGFPASLKANTSLACRREALHPSEPNTKKGSHSPNRPFSLFRLVPGYLCSSLAQSNLRHVRTNATAPAGTSTSPLSTVSN